MFWSSSQRSMNRLASILYPSMPSLRAVGRSSSTDHLYPWFSGHPFIQLSRGAIYAMCTGHTHTQTFCKPLRQHTQKYISTHWPHIYTPTCTRTVCVYLLLWLCDTGFVCVCVSACAHCFASGTMHKQATLFTVNEDRFPFTNSPYLFEWLIWKNERLWSVVCLPCALFGCVYLCTLALFLWCVTWCVRWCVTWYV